MVHSVNRPLVVASDFEGACGFWAAQQFELPGREVPVKVASV
jgi:hypothetical protein